MDTLGKRIRKIRKELDINQLDFALKIGLESATAISKYEDDSREPEIDKLIKIANLGNISLDELLTGKKSAIYNKEEQRQPVSIIKESDSFEYSAEKAENKFKITDAITMCTAVLESGTSYAGALYHNLVHFDRAVKAEISQKQYQLDIQIVNDKYLELEKALSEMRTRMDEVIDENKKLRESNKILQGLNGDCAPTTLTVDHVAPTGTEDKET